MAKYIGYYNGLFIKTKSKLKKGQYVFTTPIKKEKNTVAGSLHKYADTSKMEGEKNAFAKALIQRNL